MEQENGSECIRGMGDYPALVSSDCERTMMGGAGNAIRRGAAIFLLSGLAVSRLLTGQEANRSANASAVATAAGTVEDENGKPLARAIVVFAPAPNNSGVAVKGGHAVSDEKGAFEVKGVDPSDYAVCVLVQDPTLLNPCLWPDERVTIKLQGNEKVGGIKIRLRKGTTIRFHIDDPEGVMVSDRNPTARGVVAVGVWTKDGMFEPARKVSEDPRGQDYVLTVPNGERARPYVHGSRLRIVESDGTLHQAGSIKDFQPDRTGGERSYQFRVTAPAR